MVIITIPCDCSDRMRAEDGKLQSHLVWPKDGVGASKNSAPVIDQKHEDLFWKRALLGFSSPKVLQYSLILHWNELCIARNPGTA